MVVVDRHGGRGGGQRMEVVLLAARPGPVADAPPFGARDPIRRRFRPAPVRKPAEGRSTPRG